MQEINHEEPVSNENQVVISEDVWETRMQMIEPSRVEINKMVMNFLILEGYKDAAICFSHEA